MKHVLFVVVSVYKGWSPLSPGATIAKRLCTMNVCTFDACSNLSILYESGPLWRSLFANLYIRSRFAFGFPVTKCAENMPHMMMMVFYILCVLREHPHVIKWRCIVALAVVFSLSFDLFNCVRRRLSLLHYLLKRVFRPLRLDKEEWDTKNSNRTHNARALNKICEKKNRRRGRRSKESPKRYSRPPKRNKRWEDVQEAKSFYGV